MAKTIDHSANPVMAAILARIICPEKADWPVETARAFLDLRFHAQDSDRFHQLLARHYGDQLTATERAELNSYMCVNCFLTLLHERARRSLDKAPTASPI